MTGLRDPAHKQGKAKGVGDVQKGRPREKGEKWQEARPLDRDGRD